MMLLSFLIAASLSVAEERVTVKPVTELELAKTDILLSDIVVSKGLSRTALEKFRAIRLADAPRSGESREFTSDVVASSIREDLEGVEASTGEHYDIRIPSRVTVTKRRAGLDAGALRAQLTAAFRASCAECEFEILGLSAPAAKLPEGATWNLRTRAELPKGSFSYPIEVSVGDVPTQTLWVSGQLVVRRQVPVAAHEIAAGTRIAQEDLVTQLKDVTFASDVPVSTSELSSGVAARTLNAGEIVYHSSLRRDLAVKFGDIVKVETASADWSISLDGVAQSQGYIGDQIKVKIPSTSKVVAGVLREKGVVEVMQ